MKYNRVSTKTGVDVIQKYEQHASSPRAAEVGARRFIFTESAPRPIQSISRDVRLSVCLFVCLSPLHAIFLKVMMSKVFEMQSGLFINNNTKSLGSHITR